MGQSMVGRLAIKARQIQPGDAFAAAVPAGGLVEIVDLEGRQVAELVAFDQADPSEHLSLGVTRHESQSIMLSLGMKLYSTRGRAMLDLVEDTVGRHDLLWTVPTGLVDGLIDSDSPEDVAATPDETANGSETTEAADSDADAGNPDASASSTPVGSGSEADESAGEEPAEEGTGTETTPAEPTTTGASIASPAGSNGTAPSASAPSEAVARATVAPPTGFAAALRPFGLSDSDAPDPVNFFMQLAVMQKGDLELRAPLSERGDRVVLKALTDLIVAVRCSSATDETNAENPTDILVRVYR